ncbi:MAG TPA: hypothetical protein VD930_04735 [Gemmatimonadales bacterium]|nr:hypothetical protein [Gemmatimonadales bacterium]
MFVTIRRYSPKNGAVNKASLELLRRQIQEDFLPLIKQIPGFRGYYLVNIDNREVVTLSLCDSEDACEAATRCAADYTLSNPLMYELGRPEVIQGQVLTFAEQPPAATEGGEAAAAALALWLRESRGMLLTASDG